jgi:basic amino acid/polyamine antiporter, APA family
MTFGLFRLRRRPGYVPSCRTWGYPVTPAVFVIACAIIVLNQVLTEPVESAFRLMVVDVGLRVYYGWVRARKRPASAAGRSSAPLSAGIPGHIGLDRNGEATDESRYRSQGAS